MKTEKYNELEMELIYFENADVITESDELPPAAT